ncbi:MAG: hypothetical protein WA160_05355 [Pseudobdellovibrio sp.]
MKVQINMKKAIFYKLTFLVISLIIVVSASRLLSGEDFKNDLKQFFAFNGKTISWCPDHFVDYKWVETQLPKEFSKKWSTAKPNEINKEFCSITYEPLASADQQKVEFRPLLLVQSAEAKAALLEWSPESKLFRIQGLVFKSSGLSRELLDESK